MWTLVTAGSTWGTSMSCWEYLVHTITPAAPLTSFSLSFSHFQVLRSHLLLFRLPQHHLQLSFDMYEQLPPIRAKRLERVLGLQESSVDKGD